jgi:hypothetical protein
LIKFAKRSKVVLAILLMASIFAVQTGLSFSYQQYHMETYPNGWPGAVSSKALALYLNKHMSDSDRLMITEFAYWGMPVCAIFYYYWKGCPVLVIKGEQRPEKVIKEITMNKISWFVVNDSPHPTLNFHSLVEDMKKTVLGAPVTVGWSYVWDTRTLLSDDSDQK